MTKKNCNRDSVGNANFIRPKSKVASCTPTTKPLATMTRAPVGNKGFDGSEFIEKPVMKTIITPVNYEMALKSGKLQVRLATSCGSSRHQQCLIDQPWLVA